MVLTPGLVLQDGPLRKQAVAEILVLMTELSISSL